MIDFREDQERQDEELVKIYETRSRKYPEEEFDRGKWTHVVEKPGIGQYGLGKKVDSQYCQNVAIA